MVLSGQQQANVPEMAHPHKVNIICMLKQGQRLQCV